MVLFSKFSIESHSVASRILNTGTIHLFHHIVVLVVKTRLTENVQKVAVLEVSIPDKISQHQARLHFLKRNDPYFHVGYARKINFSSTHNIKFQKTKF